MWSRHINLLESITAVYHTTYLRIEIDEGIGPFVPISDLLSSHMRCAGGSALAATHRCSIYGQDIHRAVHRPRKFRFCAIADAAIHTHRRVHHFAHHAAPRGRCFRCTVGWFLQDVRRLARLEVHFFLVDARIGSILGRATSALDAVV